MPVFEYRQIDDGLIEIWLSLKGMPLAAGAACDQRGVDWIKKLQIAVVN